MKEYCKFRSFFKVADGARFNWINIIVKKMVLSYVPVQLYACLVFLNESSNASFFNKTQK